MLTAPRRWLTNGDRRNLNLVFLDDFPDEFGDIDVDVLFVFEPLFHQRNGTSPSTHSYLCLRIIRKEPGLLHRSFSRHALHKGCITWSRGFPHCWHGPNDMDIASPCDMAHNVDIENRFPRPVFHNQRRSYSVHCILQDSKRCSDIRSPAEGSSTPEQTVSSRSP